MESKQRHNCGDNGKGWQICCVCGGRIHEAGCTSKQDWKKDCCAARHNRLADLGYTVGIDDSSMDMRTGENVLHLNLENPTNGLPEGFPRPKEY
jgi:hypothetical protein